MIYRLMLIGALSGGVIVGAKAADLSFTPNATEMQRMPPYCKAKFTAHPESPEIKLWAERLGPSFGDIHHYCAGLNYINRYWGARTATDRSYYLNRAMDNINYMLIGGEKSGFPLLAELYSNRGDVFKLQGRQGEAVRDFRRAIEIDPKFARPYLQLIDLYEERKKRSDAMDVAILGLRHNPDSKAMQRRYLELGGKKPFPEPIAAKAAEPVPEQTIEQKPATETIIDKVSAPATSPESAPPDTIETPHPIGNTKNPFCRFCPPE